MTLGQLSSAITAQLAEAVGEGEARSMTRIIFEHLKGYTPVDMAVKRDDEVTPWLESHARDVADKVVAGQPLQYVIGVARFMGNDYKVTPATLIPRPETEGLVDMVTDFCGDRTDLSVLDACTGSGCIAVALAKALKFARVDAFDISGDALAVARENAETLHAKVNFFEADALALSQADSEKYDVIVSNPPYVLDSEARDMDRRVLDYEPHSALFVPDADPLKFYTAIARYGSHALRRGGCIFFEINPLEADNLVKALAAEGFDTEISRDYTGKERFAACRIASD